MKAPRAALPVALGGCIALGAVLILSAVRSPTAPAGEGAEAPALAFRLSALSDCMLGAASSARERLRLAPSGRAVWRDCGPHREALGAAALQTKTATQIEAPLGVLDKIPFDKPAKDLLAKTDIAGIDAALDSLRSVVCEAEPGEKFCAKGAPDALSPGLPVFDVALPEPALGSVGFASHASTTGVMTLAVVTRGRSDAARLWVARSADAGSTWKTHQHDLAALPQTRRVLLRIARQDWVLVLREHDAGETLDALSVHDAQLTPSAHIELRGTSRFERAGSIAAGLKTADGVTAVVAVTGAAKGPQLQYWSGDAMLASVPPPKPGALVGLLAEEPPHLLLASVAPTGFYELAQVKIPPPRAPFPDATRTSVAYVDQLTLSETPAARCGLPGEPFDIIAAHGPKKDAFFALSERAMYPFKFEPRAGASVQPVCGSCPPGLLERSGEGLRLFLPVRRSLSGLPIDLAAGRAPGAPGPLGVGCTTTQLVLAYPLGNDLVVQPTENESWRYAAAEVIARDVAVADVSVLGTPKHTVIAWRSQSTDRLEVFAHRRPAPTN